MWYACRKPPSSPLLHLVLCHSLMCCVPDAPSAAAAHLHKQTHTQVDYDVSRAQADGDMRMDAGQRIYLYVKPSAMMAYDDQQIDSAPLV